MSRLDNAIADVAYILDTLMAYRSIQETGGCNECALKQCSYAPKPGQIVRYNCPFFCKEDEDDETD